MVAQLVKGFRAYGVVVDVDDVGRRSVGQHEVPDFVAGEIALLFQGLEVVERGVRTGPAKGGGDGELRG